MKEVLEEEVYKYVVSVNKLFNKCETNEDCVKMHIALIEMLDVKYHESLKKNLDKQN